MPSVPLSGTVRLRHLAGSVFTLALLAAPFGLTGCGSAPQEPSPAGGTPGATTAPGQTAATTGPGATAAPGTTGPARTPGGGDPGQTTDPGGGAATPSSERPAITVTRSGGFAGVRESLAIRPDGSWTYNDKRGTKSQQGRLTPAQLTTIVKLATDPKLASEVRTQSKPGVCNDAFQYSVQVGESRASFADCGQDRPATNQLLAAVRAATPM